MIENYNEKFELTRDTYTCTCDITVLKSFMEKNYPAISVEYDFVKPEYIHFDEFDPRSLFSVKHSDLNIKCLQTVFFEELKNSINHDSSQVKFVFTNYSTCMGDFKGNPTDDELKTSFFLIVH